MSSAQGISRISYNSTIRDSVSKSPPLVTVTGQINSVQMFQSISLRSNSVLYFHLRQGLPVSLFPSGFPAKTLYEFIGNVTVLARESCGSCASFLLVAVYALTTAGAVL
jgi:hypothetical protein